MSNLPSDKEIKALFRNILFDIGNSIRLEYEKSGKYTKSGIKYKNLPNRSSAPFESPAIQSENLHSKIDVNVIGDKEVKIGSNVKYLKFLELGTNKMQPRNGLEIALKKTNIIKIIDTKIERFFR